jgi:hypothetical protein
VYALTSFMSSNSSRPSGTDSASHRGDHLRANCIYQFLDLWQSFAFWSIPIHAATKSLRYMDQSFGSLYSIDVGRRCIWFHFLFEIVFLDVYLYHPVQKSRIRVHGWCTWTRLYSPEMSRSISPIYLSLNLQAVVSSVICNISLIPTRRHEQYLR